MIPALLGIHLVNLGLTPSTLGGTGSLGGIDDTLIRPVVGVVGIDTVPAVGAVDDVLVNNLGTPAIQ